MPNNEFLEKLLQKLKSSDARSIHLNALPSNYSRIDIYDFVNINQSLHLQFLNELLSKQNFKFSISIDANTSKNKTTEEKTLIDRLIKKLNSLYYDEQESEQQFGYNSFGFGYPLLIKRDVSSKDKIIKAPLFIWYLKIERDTRKSNTWHISRNEDLSVVLNPILMSYLQSNEKISLAELYDFLDDDLVTEQELLKSIELITEKLGNKQTFESYAATILPCANKDSIEVLTKDEAWVRFSGVFGLYKTMKQSIINDVETIINENSIEQISQQQFPIHYDTILTPIRLDDTQEQILYELQHQQKVIIQGPPGTGKSQTLTAIISNALLNKKKVLVVCEKKTALSVLQDNLNELGLDELSILIEDVYRDRRAVVEKIRQYIETKNQTLQRFRENDFEQSKSVFLDEKAKVNNLIEHSQIPFFGDDNLIELIIKKEALKATLSIDEQQQLSQLHNNLRNNIFEFNYNEFLTLKPIISEAKKYITQLPKEQTVFNEMSVQLFQSNDYSKIEQLLVYFYNTIADLKKSIQANKSFTAYNVLNGFQAFWSAFLALFVASKKQQRQQQKIDVATFKKVSADWNTNPLFNVVLNEVLPQTTTDECVQELSKIDVKLNALFADKSNLEVYTAWRKFILVQNENTKLLLDALAKYSVKNTSLVFEIWFYEQAILNYMLKNNLTDNNNPNFPKLANEDVLLKEKLKSKILNIWNETKQQALLKQDETNLKYLYNLRKNKQYESKNTLRKIVNDDITFFTDCFPVVLTNPSVCSTIFPAQPIFDLVILDEASQLKIEETYSSLLRGKQHVISGDKHQMPPSNFFGNKVLFWSETEEEDTSEFWADAQSLLEFAEDTDYKNYYIDFHYRSKHPDLIQFSNHAFYQSRLIPMPEKKSYQSIDFIEVNGLYDKGINKDEALAIVNYIYSIDISKNVPSIGVGTFNLHQRNYIFDLLYEQAHADEIKSKHLGSLLERGLFVKNLENIQGDERDIILISTTFGLNKEGKFRQLFGPVSQEKGYKLLNVLVTRAKEKLVLFTSIPQSYYLQYADEIKQKGNTGKGVLYAYLAYAKSVADNNVQQKLFVLNNLSTNDTKLKNQLQTTEYINFIYDELQSVFQNQIFKNYIFGGLNLDLVVKKDDRVALHICLVENNEVAKQSNYRTFLHLEKILLNYNIPSMPISLNEFVSKKEQIIKEINAML